MKNKPQITILFGTDKDVKKTYVFEDETQKAFFIKGVDEANGYLEYEIQEDKFITQRNKQLTKRKLWKLCTKETTKKHLKMLN